MRRLWFLAPLALLALGIAQARASISYQYVADANNFSAAAGGTVTVDIFLQENLTGSSTSIINADGGLFGAGFLVSQTGGPTTGATTINVGSMQFNTNNQSTGAPPGFGSGAQQSNVPNTTTQTGGLVNVGNATTAPNATNISAVGSRTLPSTITNAVLLGTFTLTAGSANSITTYTIQSYNHFSGAAGNTLTFSGDDLDVSGTAVNGEQYVGADDPTVTAFTFKVTATPEPGGMVLSGLAGCVMVGGLGYAGYRRRKAQLLKLDAAA